MKLPRRQYPASSKQEQTGENGQDLRKLAFISTFVLEEASELALRY
jgi:hypothetical protein